MMKFLRRLICWKKGRVRGRREGEREIDGALYTVFRCPRCSATWTRKARQKAVA